MNLRHTSKLYTYENIMVGKHVKAVEVITLANKNLLVICLPSCTKNVKL